MAWRGRKWRKSAFDYERETATGKEPVVNFQSWGDAIDYASRKPKTHPSYSQSRVGDPSWTMTESFDAAVELARNGWEEGANKAKVFSTALVDTLGGLVEKQTVLYDVEGTECDVATALTGVPEFMMRWETHLEEGAGSIVRIVVNGFFSGAIKHDVIVARGGAIAALVELLEMSGRRCEVVLHLPYTHQIHFRTILKSADQPLDLPRLIFAVGHPSSFRRIGFSHYEQHPDVHQPGYGMPYTLHPDHQGDIYFECAGADDGSWLDINFAKEFVIETLKEQGVELK